MRARRPRRYARARRSRSCGRARLPRLVGAVAIDTRRCDGALVEDAVPNYLSCNIEHTANCRENGGDDNRSNLETFGATVCAGRSSTAARKEKQTNEKTQQPLRANTCAEHTAPGGGQCRHPRPRRRQRHALNVLRPSFSDPRRANTCTKHTAPGGGQCRHPHPRPRPRRRQRHALNVLRSSFSDARRANTCAKHTAPGGGRCRHPRPRRRKRHALDDLPSLTLDEQTRARSTRHPRPRRPSRHAKLCSSLRLSTAHNQRIERTTVSVDLDTVGSPSTSHATCRENSGTSPETACNCQNSTNVSLLLTCHRSSCPVSVSFPLRPVTDSHRTVRNTASRNSAVISLGSRPSATLQQIHGGRPKSPSPKNKHATAHVSHPSDEQT